MSDEPPRPTDAELEILTVLWSRGPSTVRDVHEVIAGRKPAQYTTVLKMLQIMAEKGLVRRDERSEEHTSELQSLRHLVCRLLLEKKKTNHSRINPTVKSRIHPTHTTTADAQ